MPMKIARPVYALWCGPGCQPQSCRTVKELLNCLTPDPCGNGQC